MAKSVKERFPIKVDHITDFLGGDFQPKDTMEKWMKPDKSGLKLIKSTGELESAKVLAQEYQEDVLKFKLRPMVRTVYSRTAFQVKNSLSHPRGIWLRLTIEQARDNNDVRISIDEQLTMVNEWTPSTPHSQQFSWCRDMDATKLSSSDVLQFPYCILEVKLNCETPPAWITELLAQKQIIMPRPKFSKFLTGAAYHHYERIPELPYWFQDELALDPRNRFLSPEQKEALVSTLSSVNGKPQPLGMDSPASEKKPRKESSAGTGSAAPAPASAPFQIQVPDERTPLLSGSNSQDSFSTERLTRAGSSVERSPETATTTTTMGIRRRVTSALAKILPCCGIGSGHGSANSSARGGGVSKMKPVRSNARIKIEPKTSFALERTLIQWVSAASLMITLATIIITSGNDLGFKAGFVFFPLAFVILLYAR